MEIKYFAAVIITIIIILLSFFYYWNISGNLTFGNSCKPKYVISGYGTKSDYCRFNCYHNYGVTSFKTDAVIINGTLTDACWCDMNNCNP